MLFRYIIKNEKRNHKSVHTCCPAAVLIHSYTQLNYIHMSIYQPILKIEIRAIYASENGMYMFVYISNKLINKN